jgi:adenylyl-sulfate kinase
VARLFADAGIICIAAFISPYRGDRDLARKIAQPGKFIEVYLNAPLEVCEGRDPKGLYARARAGEIKDFTGISAPYEPPLKPEIELPTNLTAVAECVDIILKRLDELLPL